MHTRFLSRSLRWGNEVDAADALKHDPQRFGHSGKRGNDQVSLLQMFGFAK